MLIVERKYLMKSLFIVNGWFSQHGLRLQTNDVGEIVEIYLGEKQAHYPFLGIFTFENTSSGNGEINDRCGTAIVKNIAWHARTITFEKKYLNREDVINYSLIGLGPVEERLYIGHYHGSLVGRGECRLIIHPLPLGFFE